MSTNAFSVPQQMIISVLYKIKPEKSTIKTLTSRHYINIAFYILKSPSKTDGDFMFLFYFFKDFPLAVFSVVSLFTHSLVSAYPYFKLLTGF